MLAVRSLPSNLQNGGPVEMQDSDDEFAKVDTARRPAVDLNYAELITKKEGAMNMCLKHQLVIWKKTAFLLDNIAFTRDLCGALVEADLFTSDMMTKIMSQRYETEKILVLLSYLGCHGDNIYEKFLTALENSKHDGVARELRRTDRFTKFGEHLPAMFHYFLNLSEFLRTYPHIGVKLGEDEKHLLTSFIDGHIEVGVRKNHEKLERMAEKLKEQRNKIRDLKSEIKVKDAKERALREAVEKARTTIETLRKKLAEAEEIAMQNRNEARKLRHFRVQQEDLIKFINEKAEEANMPESLPRQMTTQIMQIKQTLEEKVHAERQNSFANNRQASNLARTNKLGSRQNSKITSRQNSKIDNLRHQLSKMQPTNPDTVVTNFRMVHTRVNLLTNKIFFLMQAMQGYESEEKRLKEALDAEGKEQAYRSQLKRAFLEIRKEKQATIDQLKSSEKEFYEKEAYLNELRKEMMGIGGTPADVEYYKLQHESLVTKMEQLLQHLRNTHDERLQEQSKQHQLELDRYLAHIQDLKNKHQEEESKLKLKIRMKIAEINDREKLIARLKKQISTMVNYNAKNMNAQVPVEECRRITRSIIGEARKLKAIAEEKARDQAEIEKLEAMGVEDAAEVFAEQKRQEEERKRKRQEKRKRKKKPEFLADDRLRYLADRLCLEWRILGKCLGLTNNRMDMVEWDLPPNSKQDMICFTMLKSWRDDENGKVAELVEALKQMSRDDLAIIVMPVDQMHLLRSKKKKDGSDGEDNDDDDEEGDDGNVTAGEEGDTQSVLTSITTTGRRKGKLTTTQSMGSLSVAGGLTSDGEDGPMSEAETVRSSRVPKLPDIKRQARGPAKKPGKARGKSK